MPSYRLHYFPESGNSYKLALMLTLCGETFEPVWTDFGGGVTRTAEWRKAVNEMGEIPVLEIDGVRHATATERRPESWLMRVEASGSGVTTDDVLTSEERADEFLLMGLRLAEGIDPQRYQALAGRSLDPDRIASLREQGAITIDRDGRLRVTRSGFPVLDAVVADLAA